jgi:hypothetical protein
MLISMNGGIGGSRSNRARALASIFARAIATGGRR